MRTLIASLVYAAPMTLITMIILLVGMHEELSNPVMNLMIGAMILLANFMGGLITIWIARFCLWTADKIMGTNAKTAYA